MAKKLSYTDLAYILYEQPRWLLMTKKDLEKALNGKEEYRIHRVWISMGTVPVLVDAQESDRDICKMTDTVAQHYKKKFGKAK